MARNCVFCAALYCAMCGYWKGMVWDVDIVEAVDEAGYPSRAPSQIGTLLAEMTASSVRIDLQTTAFDAVKATALPGATGPPSTGREPWFGFDYVTFDLQPALLQQWAAPHTSPELSLPPANSFIATDFGLVGQPRIKTEPWPCSPPCLLLDRPGLRCAVWHMCSK